MQVYLVGGAVRDALLNRKVTERDYVVVGATPEQMIAKGFTQVGKDFPVFLHPKTNEEYALARTERKSGKGYTGFICDASTGVTLEDDLTRRDLTVNAMAQDSDGKIIDPHNGKQDLDNKCLRHVSDAFSEDPLRVFRVARFAARYAYLGFTIADETLALMSTMAASGELQALSAERVWQETKRSLVERSPEVYFATLSATGGLNDWFSELIPVINESIEVLRSAAKKDTPPTDGITLLIARFTSLCISLSEEQVSALCRRLKTQNQVSEIATLACKFKGILLSKDDNLASTASHVLTADSLLMLFNGTDAWRRPERFESLLNAVRHYAEFNGVMWDARQSLIAQALRAANGVNVQDIIAKGIKGPAIKDALNEEKRSAIEQVITHSLKVTK